MIAVTYAPMDWQGLQRKHDQREHSRFRTHWNNTRDLLDKEIEALGGRRVVWQLDYTGGQIRRDGTPRADAKMGPFPGFRLLFDVPRGPNRQGFNTLAFQSDRYRDWHDNVRAVALSLEALRAVDRHGVTSASGEQYKGFLAIEAGSTAVSDAETFLRLQSNLPASSALIHHYRSAAKRLHPDLGDEPNADNFHRLQQAKEALGL